MTENPILSKNSARAAGVLTLSGLMVGGVALAQGAGAAPEVQPAAQVTKAVTLDAFHQELSYVPASLARPEIAPKSHEQLAQEKAEREAEERAAAEREKAEREAREAEEREAAEREQAEREAQEREAAEAEAEQHAAEEQAAAEQVEVVEATAPQAEQVRTIEAAPAAQQSAPAQTAGNAPNRCRVVPVVRRVRPIRTDDIRIGEGHGRHRHLSVLWNQEPPAVIGVRTAPLRKMQE